MKNENKTNEIVSEISKLITKLNLTTTVKEHLEMLDRICEAVVYESSNSSS
jgi:hypothetical protein